MRLINKKSLILLTSSLLVIISLLVLKQTKPVELDEVKLLEASNNTSFAMYKEDGEVYTEVEGNTFPEGYKLNLEKSKCLDNNGNEIKEVLSYDNYQVKLTSNKTTYCYLYFDKTLGVEIKDKNSNGLKTDKIRGDMYRYQGQQTDNIENYICFGTSDSQICKDHPNQYMYRIIGIEATTGRVKVIKKEALDQTYQWYTDEYVDVKLPDSIVFSAINGTAFLDNETFFPIEDWKDKISDNNWLYGDMGPYTDGAEQFGNGLYEVESGKKETKCFAGGNNTVSVQWTDTIESQISLMYLHDYAYSIGDETNCFQNKGLNKCNLGWISLTQNDDNAPSNYESFATREGLFPMGPGRYFVFSISNDGKIEYHNNLAASFAIRPVFYIDASQSLKDGTGKIDDPFIINE